jgi:hypothetical protein
MSGINAQVAELSWLLRDGSCYSIPIYQRRYAWRAEGKGHPLDDLWEDVRTTLQRKRDGQHYMHFFGPLVVISSAIPGIFFLVDGQQRLTTMILLVRAIREWAQTRGFLSLVAKADAFLLSGQPGLPDDRRLKLVPSRDDRDELLSILGLRADSSSDGLLSQVFNWLKRRVQDDYVAGWKDSDAEQNLADLLDVVASRFQMVRIEIGGDEYAYEIFHSLNTKGTPLAESDKVKNYCFMKLSALGEGELDAIHRDIWEAMAREVCAGDVSSSGFEAATLDRFLLVFLWIAWRGDFGQRQVYGEFKRYFESRLPRTEKGLDRSAEPAITKALLTELKTDYAPAFAIVRHPLKLLVLPQEKPLRDAIARLRHLGCGEDVDYLLVELLRNYLHFNRPVPAAVRSVYTITSYFIWRRLCRMSAKAHNRIFSSIARNLRNERLSCAIQTMDQFVESLSRDLIVLTADDRWPDQRDDLREQLIQGGQYRGRSADFVKHILWYLEKGVMDGEPDGSLSVEHVFPGTPSDEWRLLLGENEYRLMEQRANGLPNLTLLESNEPPLQNEAGNLVFTAKRNVYAKSGIQLTKDLCALTEWRPGQLEARADDLVKRIGQLWPRPKLGEQIL